MALWARLRHAEPLDRRTVCRAGARLDRLLPFQFPDFLGLQYISAGLERLILFLYPTMTVILAVIGVQASHREQDACRDGAELCRDRAGIHARHGDEAGRQRRAGRIAYLPQHPLVFDLPGGAGHAIARIGTARFTAYAMVVASAASLLQFGVTRPLSALDLPLRVYEFSIAMAIFSTVLPVFLLVSLRYPPHLGRAARR